MLNTLKISKNGIVVVSAKEIYESINVKGRFSDFVRKFEILGIKENIGYSKIKRGREIDYVLRGYYALLLLSNERHNLIEVKEVEKEIKEAVIKYEGKLLVDKNDLVKILERIDKLNLDTTYLTPMTEISKLYGISAISMNKILVFNGVIHSSVNTYCLTLPFFGKGLAKYVSRKVESDSGFSRIKNDFYWTQKGMRFIEEMMRAMRIERGA